MRIGINALYLIPGGVGGTEIYLRGLLAALAELEPVHEYFVFTNRETGSALAPKAPNFVTMAQPVRASFRPARLAWEQLVLPLAVARLRLDALLNPGFTAPIACSCPQVTVFHDLQHCRHPEYFRWFDLPFWKFFLYWAARVSPIVIADSRATAGDLRRFYRLPERQIRVVPLAADPVFFELAAQRRPERFVLAVSTLHPHKNLDNLLRAFARFHAVHPDYRLVVCGIHGFFAGPLHDLRNRLGLAGAVDFPGWIPRRDLHDLYTRAAAFVYPSRFEGFGIPVLESLAAGIPTAHSNIEPLVSVSEGAALLFDPDEPADMADCMRRLFPAKLR